MNRSFYFFGSILFVLAFLGYGACLWAFYETLSSHHMFQQHFCLLDSCVTEWSEKMEGPLSIGKATSDLLVAFATVGGVLVALQTYLFGVRNSAFTNHLGHVASFQSYLLAEIGKRPRINSSSIDTFFLYNFIFPYSRTGKMRVSDEYQKSVEKINNCILQSNGLAGVGQAADFRYVPHQGRMIDVLKLLGITIQRQPRNDFFEIEDQILSLVDSLNNSFCFSKALEILSKRHYR
jgi:hypothetical protein